MADCNQSRSKQVYTSRVGETFQVSNCRLTVSECVLRLENAHQSSCSKCIKAQLEAKRNLLQELCVVKYMPVSIAYDEYIGMQPAKFHPKYTDRHDAIRDFVNSILSDKGLPVLIVNGREDKKLLLWEGCGENTVQTQFFYLDKLLSEDAANNNPYTNLQEIGGHFKNLLNLLTTRRERAVTLCMLSMVTSATSLRHLCGINEDDIARIRRTVFEYMEASHEEEADAQFKAHEKVKDMIDELEKSLEVQKTELENQSSRLSDIEKPSRKFDIKNKSEILNRLKLNTKKTAKRIARAQIK